MPPVRLIFRTVLLSTLAAALSACRLPARETSTVLPLDREGELEIYLDPLPPETEALDLELAAITVRATSTTTERPLELRLRTLGGSRGGERGERGGGHVRLAAGRLPPGDYAGVVVEVAKARLASGSEGSALTVDPRRSFVPAPFTVRARRAVLLHLALRPEGLVRDGDKLAARFERTPGAPLMPGALGVSADSASHHLTLFDKPTREPVAIVPTGREPAGLALDVLARRAYVAIAREDAVEAFDLVSEELVRRVPLRPGDQPAEVALARDVLVVACAGSNTVTFIDARGLVEVGRVPVGPDPQGLVVDAAGRHVYVLSGAADQLAVIDTGNRAVLRTVPTESRPLRAAPSPDGRQLYVVHAGSPFMVSYQLPELTLTSRVYVGLGVLSLAVHPTTGRIFVGISDRTIQIFEPGAQLASETVDVPGAVTLMSIDPVENALALLLPERDRIQFLRLSDHTLAGSVQVGSAPRWFVLP